MSLLVLLAGISGAPSSPAGVGEVLPPDVVATVDVGGGGGLALQDQRRRRRNKSVIIGWYDPDEEEFIIGRI